MQKLTHEIKDLKKHLTRFLKRFKPCIKTAPSRRHMETYVAGQVSSLERKNMEAIAIDKGIKPRTLQAFMGTLAWDENAVARKLREIIKTDHADDAAIGIIDETSHAKKGDKTVGVKRQHCGSTGKQDNCVVTVHLAYASAGFAALADADLYLPKDWCEDHARRREAGVPEDIEFRTKTEIALTIVQRTLAEGVPMKYLCADELYGRSGHFRRSIAALGLTYAVEIPCNLTGWTERRLKQGKAALRVDKLWRRGGPKRQRFHVKNTGKGAAVWEVRAGRVAMCEDGFAAPAQWLLIVRNVLSGEVKYFLCNASPDAPVATMLHVAFRRWQIERLFEDAKGEAGFDHAEMRQYLPHKRHVILTMTSILFLFREVVRLRKKRVMESAERAVKCGVAA